MDDAVLEIHASDSEGTRYRTFVEYLRPGGRIIRANTFLNRSEISEGNIQGPDTEFLEFSKDNIYHSFKIIDYNNNQQIRFVLDRRARQTPIPRATQRPVQRRPRTNYGRRITRRN